MSRGEPAWAFLLRWRHWLAWGLPLACAVPIIALACRPIAARWIYQPQEGDIVFQSLPPSRLSVAIEGATHSPLSHCGIVARRNGHWVVIEAYREVEETPLAKWLRRGDGGEFIVCRLREPYDRHIPAMIDAARNLIGRPYDIRYRWDDERIYCSELISKAYQHASGSTIGKTVRLEQLDWQPYRETIENFEQGPIPLKRGMLTPRDLARAAQLQEVYRFGL